jgi:hypothetical protein
MNEPPPPVGGGGGAGGEALARRPGPMGVGPNMARPQALPEGHDQARQCQNYIAEHNLTDVTAALNTHTSQHRMICRGLG